MNTETLRRRMWSAYHHSDKHVTPELLEAALIGPDGTATRAGFLVIDLILADRAACGWPKNLETPA